MTAQMTSQEFNRIRIAFMRRMKNPSIPTIAFKLAWLIAYEYMNSKTQVAYPAQNTLAADLGVSVRTIQRLLDILERHGLAIVPGDGRGRASTYWINSERVTPESAFPPRKGDRALSPFAIPKGRHPTTKKGDRALSPQPIRKNQRKDPSDLSIARTRAKTPFPDGWEPTLDPTERTEFEKFKASALAHGRVYANWEQAWRNWKLNIPNFKPAHQQENPNGRSLLATFERAIDRDAAAAYVPGSEGPQPITLDRIPRAAGIRSLPKG